MTALSAQEIVALAERTREATKGPWHASRKFVYVSDPYHRIVASIDDRNRAANAALIAAAPALLATALKQQEENATLRDAVRQAQGVLATLSNPRPGESTMHVYAAVVAAEAKCRAALSPKTETVA